MADLQELLQQIRHAEGLGENITLWRTLQARAGTYGDWPGDVDRRLVDTLGEQGIGRLYIHQSLAVERILAGHDVVVVTPTASGKTLCYNLPVLQMLLREPASRALYLFPTKALAHDQLDNLRTRAEPLGLADGLAAYDGDTPAGRRSQIRRQARIIFSSPDMLHAGILPYHTRWRAFFAHLRYIVVDEIHQYRGVFGSHVANVLRRAARICRFYGSSPQFICCSATIANPRSLATKLIGREPTLVDTNGAPRGKQTLIFYNPPISNPQLGLRRSPSLEARELANHLLAQDIQTIVFTRSRLGTELLLRYLRQDAAALGRDPQAIHGYRGGYLPSDRRRIEGQLRAGAARAVVATNALELGIDISGLEACLMVGYPGTIASTWQQAGRAGRGLEDSAAFLIASSAPLDQYIVSHPDYFFQQSPEQALINPDNLYLLVDHLKCAAYELPFGQDEQYGQRHVDELLRLLEDSGLLRYDRGTWYWASEEYPAQEVSLRTADPRSVTIIAADGDGQTRTIGQIDRASVPLLVHESAIYMHNGEQYLVEELDWDGGLARVRPVVVDYYTRASQNTDIHVDRVLDETSHGDVQLARGEITVTSRVTSYRRLRLGTLENLGWGTVDLPEQQMRTFACWMTVSEQLVERLRVQGSWVGEQVTDRGPSWPRQRDLARRRDGFRCCLCNAPERPGQRHHVHHRVPFREFGWMPGQNETHIEANRLSNLMTLCPSCHRRAEQNVAVQSTLAGLGRVLRHLLPLYLMCDPHDIQVISYVQAPQTKAPTIFFIDSVPGGIGLVDELPTLIPELLHRAAERVRDCPCPSGCPSCIGPQQADGQAKQRVLQLAAALRRPFGD